MAQNLARKCPKALPTPEFSVRESVSALIRSGVVDPRAIAKKLLLVIPQAVLREMTLEMLSEHVRQVHHDLRMPSFHVAAKGERTKSPRWEAHVQKQLTDTGYEVNGEWKQLGKLTAADCRSIAADYSKRAEQNTAKAETFARLAEACAKKRCTVGGLPQETIAEIFG